MPGTSAERAADAAFMERALQLAAQGVALASPNPVVGAVLVRDQRVIGEGFHRYDRRQHAEIVALAAAGAAARGSTLYVSLEPCCHTGRTGPCTEALIGAGVSRVVAAIRDPNPAVAGRGLRQLRAAGIAVSLGVCSAAARKSIEAFAKWITTHRPLVTCKIAMTLDGRMTLATDGGHSRRARRHRWITGADSLAEVHRMRHASDALLTGIGTILADDPLLTDRTSLPRRRKLLRVVMDSRLRLPLHSQIVKSAEDDVLVLTCASAKSARARVLQRAGVEVVQLPARAGKPDLSRAMAYLGKREIVSVLLEAGPILSSAAIAAGVADKIRVFIAPKLSGFVDGPGPFVGLASARTLRDVTLAQFGQDIAVEGYF
jgi:diaminohydroxyphosphoribosylaminopyrimidine deaminase/5-amino-6-(5-phosphoribosylamino)uracil reductase